MLARLPAFAARADHQTARRTGPRRPRAGVGTGHVRFNYLREVGVPARSHPGGTPGANGSGHPGFACLISGAGLTTLPPGQHDGPPGGHGGPSSGQPGSRTNRSSGSTGSTPRVRPSVRGLILLDHGLGDPAALTDLESLRLGPSPDVGHLLPVTRATAGSSATPAAAPAAAPAGGPAGSPDERREGITDFVRVLFADVDLVRRSL